MRQQIRNAMPFYANYFRYASFAVSFCLCLLLTRPIAWL